MKRSSRINVATFSIVLMAASCRTDVRKSDTAGTYSVGPTTADGQGNEGGASEGVGVTQQALTSDCGGTIYDTDFQLCCGGTLWSKGVLDACCGQWAYDSSVELCCGGRIWGKGPNTTCCGDYPC